VQADQPIAEVESDGIRSAIRAGFSGRVVDVTLNQRVTIEGTATVLQGIVGIGGPAVGTLTVLPRGESLAMVPIPRGGVILFPQQLPLMLIQRAVAGGAAGIITGSVSAREFEGFSRMDLSAALDGFPLGAVPPPPLTIVVTEGLGAAPMSSLLVQVLAQRLNTTVYLCGETSIQQAIRPEVIFTPPLSQSAQPLPLRSTLEPGARVMAWAGAHRGMPAQIIQMPQRRHYSEAGLLVPGAILRFEDGSTDIVPLHLLDRIG
jgi:pyruvate/2-oxoglutarate dehydrogenase complex dihydrolipoamide acyltransferase (E2) component